MRPIGTRRHVPALVVAAMALPLLSGCGGGATTVVTVTQTVTAPGRGSTDGGGLVTVPNAVGMNYQDAQDLWRGLGLIVMPAEDATGAHRLPVIDSNWVVVGQDPAPGTPLSRGSKIRATVKKYTDS